MASAARRQIIGGGAPINKSGRRRRPQIVGGGTPANGSTANRWVEDDILPVGIVDII